MLPSVKAIVKLVPYYLVSLALAKWFQVLQCEMLCFKDRKPKQEEQTQATLKLFRSTPYTL